MKTLGRIIKVTTKIVDRLTLNRKDVEIHTATEKFAHTNTDRFIFGEYSKILILISIEKVLDDAMMDHKPIYTWNDRTEKVRLNGSAIVTYKIVKSIPVEKIYVFERKYKFLGILFRVDYKIKKVKL